MAVAASAMRMAVVVVVFAVDAQERPSIVTGGLGRQAVVVDDAVQLASDSHRNVLMNGNRRRSARATQPSFAAPREHPAGVQLAEMLGRVLLGAKLVGSDWTVHSPLRVRVVDHSYGQRLAQHSQAWAISSTTTS